MFIILMLNEVRCFYSWNCCWTIDKELNSNKVRKQSKILCVWTMQMLNSYFHPGFTNNISFYIYWITTIIIQKYSQRKSPWSSRPWSSRQCVGLLDVRPVRVRVPGQISKQNTKKKYFFGDFHERFLNKNLLLGIDFKL